MKCSNNLTSLSFQQLVTKSNERYCKARTEVYYKPHCQLHAVVDVKWQILHKNC